MTRSERAILVLVFCDLAGFGMLIPDVQLRAEALGARGLTIGLILSSMFLVQALCSPLFGTVADRLGKKPVILACTALSALSMLIYAGAGSLWVILASRILAGFGAGNLPAAQALAAASVDASERTATMARIGAATTAGLTIGPAIGGVLVSVGGVHLLGGVAGLSSLFGLLAAAILVPNQRADARDDSGGKPASILRNRLLLAVLAVSALSWFGLALLEGTFGRLIHRNLGYGQLVFGVIFGYESLISVLAQGLVAKKLSNLMSDRRLVVAGLAIEGIGLGSMPFAPNLPLLFGGATLFAIGTSFAGPALTGWSSKLAPPEQQGQALGILQSMRSAGFLIGPALGGMLFDWRASAPYVLAASMCCATAAGVELATRISTPAPEAAR